MRSNSAPHCGSEAAFGHHGMRFAEQRFADDANARALRQRFNRRAQSRAARADNQNVVLVLLVICGHISLGSWKAPVASMRM